MLGNRNNMNPKNQSPNQIPRQGVQMKTFLRRQFAAASLGAILSALIVMEANADKQVSVSGVSSGAYMAVQLQVAYSKTFMGVGSIAGGPYYCAENMTDITAIKLKCMAGQGIIPDDYAPYRDEAIELSKEGKIDDVSNLGQSKVFIFNSVEDQIINPGLGYLSVLFFQHFSDNPADDVLALNAIPGYLNYAVAHGMPTSMDGYDDYINYVDQATPCSPANSQQYPWFPNEFLRGNDPWLYHCPYPNEYAPVVEGYSMAKDLLDHIYGSMNEPVEAAGQITSHQQLQFVDDPDIKTVDDLHKHGIGESLYVYTPSSCKDDPSQCDKLHVALHGCQQFPEWTFTGKVGSKKAGQNMSCSIPKPTTSEPPRMTSIPTAAGSFGHSTMKTRRTTTPKKEFKCA